MGLRDHKSKEALIYLKTGAAYKPETSPRQIRAFTSPKKASKGSNSWENLGRGGPLQKRWIAGQHNHRDRRRKQTGALLKITKTLFFIENRVTVGKLANGQLPLAALKKSGKFCSRDGRAGGAILQGRTASFCHTSLGQGKVCRLQPLCLLADVLLHCVTLS